MLQGVAVCCSVLRYVRYGLVCPTCSEEANSQTHRFVGLLQCVAVCCNVLQCVAVNLTSLDQYRANTSDV